VAFPGFQPRVLKTTFLEMETFYFWKKKGNFYFFLLLSFLIVIYFILKIN